MENKIRLLPEIVANQIAAGEVVESPSSVVKEMMENAIDAGAKSVTVNFRQAGLELLQIQGSLPVLLRGRAGGGRRSDRQCVQPFWLPQL